MKLILPMIRLQLCGFHVILRCAQLYNCESSQLRTAQEHASRRYFGNSFRMPHYGKHRPSTRCALLGMIGNLVMYLHLAEQSLLRKAL